LPNWQPKTYTGYFNIRKLRLSSDGKIEKRENRLKAQSLYAESKEKLAEALNLQDQAMKRGMEEVQEKLRTRVAELRSEITFWEQQLTPELEND
jgi:anti-sigma28 factor (negative regulator of flagellin synthesis)